MPPIIIFAYLRHDLLLDMLASLKNCAGFHGRAVFAFQDGLKPNATEENQLAHAKTTKVIEEASNEFWNITVSETNLGLAQSVHRGVSQVLAKHDAAIILEDDLLLAPDFLTFMDECLKKFADRKDVYSISGFSHGLQNKGTEKGVFLFPRPGSWGWATWANRWNGFELNDIEAGVLNNRTDMKRFDTGGEDMSWMLRNCLTGKVNSWAIQWSYYQHKHSAYSVYPDCSKVHNTGFRDDATHTTTKVNFKESKHPGGNICSEPIHVSSDLRLDSEKIIRYSKNYRLGLVTQFKKALRLGMF